MEIHYNHAPVNSVVKISTWNAYNNEVTPQIRESCPISRGKPSLLLIQTFLLCSCKNQTYIYESMSKLTATECLKKKDK